MMSLWASLYICTAFIEEIILSLSNQGFDEWEKISNL